MKTSNLSTSIIVNRDNSGTTRSLSRRTFMQLSGLGLGGLLLGACKDNPPNPSPISWQPHALTPVFYGHKDYGTSEGAPGKCRVFYPSLDGSPQNAAILPARYPFPLIVMMHGHCDEMNHYTKWFQLPAQLARCGYVVVVPELPGIAIQKHMAVFKDGRHWDYLQSGTSSCENGRGPCTRTPVITADLISMFFAKYLQPKYTSSLSLRIPDSLIPPLPLQLTFEQEFYAGSHLTGFPISSNSGCNLTLSWDTYNSTGSV